MTSQSIIQGIVLLLYLIAMVMVGFVFYKKNSTHSDYVLGGRGMNVWVTSLSAQASDMSGWLLMGLPGTAYLLGSGATNAIWTAIGLALGTYFNWLIVAKPLRKYTQIAGNSITIPDFLQNRFHSKSNVLRIFSALFILIFFTVYTSSMFAAGANLFDYVFGIGYIPALILSVVVVTAYTFLGGFKAVCWTDLFQGLLMFAAIIVVPCFMYKGLTSNTFEWSEIGKITLGVSEGFGAMGIVSAIAWGLGYFGMPHVLLRFMAIGDANKLKLSRRVATVWVVISMAVSVFIGVIGNAMTKAGVLPTLKDPETIILVVADLISKHGVLATIIAGLILAGILAATMSTADSQLLAASSSASQNILKEVFMKDMSEKTGMLIARITVLVIALIGVFIARNPDSSVFQIVSFAWAGFGASFGPLVLLALFWKRSTFQGALCGMVSGGVMVFVWKFLIRPMGGALGIYELLPAFLLGLAVNVIVSLLTPAPSREVQDEFDKVASMK